MNTIQWNFLEIGPATLQLRNCNNNMNHNYKKTRRNTRKIKINYFITLFWYRKLTEGTAVVTIYFKRKTVVDIQKAPLMPFNELLGTYLIFKDI